MKKEIFILITLTFISCKKENVNINVEYQFKKCIQTVKDYDPDSRLMGDSMLAYFYFSTEYLSELTNIKADYIVSDIPQYLNREKCLKDICKWNKWFIKNKSHITKEYSDSIVKHVLKKNIWWNNDYIKY